MGTHPIFESDFDCLTEMDEIDDDVNKLVKIGGTALLGSSLFAAATVAVGRSQMAKKMYGSKKDNIDARLAHEASNLAMRTFGRATAYVFGAFGTLVGGACYNWNVYSIRDLRRQVKSIRGVQVSKEGAEPTTWEDIFPDEEEQEQSKSN